MSTCRSCGAEIVWAKTEHGRTIPLDAKPERRFVLNAGEGISFDSTTIARSVPTFGSHFATCPNADEHRKT